MIIKSAFGHFPQEVRPLIRGPVGVENEGKLFGPFKFCK